MDHAGADETVLADKTLSALAWARSRPVVTALIEWSWVRPAWCAGLYLAPHEYAQVAGYEIVQGKIRDLTLPGALGIVPVPRDGDDADLALFEVDAAGPLCPRCGHPPSLLLRFESKRRLLPQDVRDRIPTCLSCACTGTFFVRLEPGGAWHWLAKDTPREVGHGGRKLPPAKARLNPRPDWEAADDGIAEAPSQIGGYPVWVQDPDYPACPVVREHHEGHRAGGGE